MRPGAFFVFHARTGLRVGAVLAAALAGFGVAPYLHAEPVGLWVRQAAAPALGPVPAVAGEGRAAADATGQADWVEAWKAWAVAHASGAAWPGTATLQVAAAAPETSQPAISSDLSAPARQPSNPAWQSGRTPARGPMVAIYHTHTSEMYRMPGFSPSDPLEYHRFGTVDTGVVRVGDALAQTLDALGVSVVHVTTIHDYPKFDLAYARSRETVRALVERYPSLRLIIDLHRDAPQEDNALVTSVDGAEAAQVAIVIGTGSGGPQARANLVAARALANALDARFPGVFRRVMERPGRTYNQEVHPGAVLIEIGSYRTDEGAAIRTARLLAQAIADVLLARPSARDA